MSRLKHVISRASTVLAFVMTLGAAAFNLSDSDARVQRQTEDRSVAAQRGQASYSDESDLHRYGGRIHSAGAALDPHISDAPAAFGSGRRVMRLQADPGGLPSISQSGKPAFGGGFADLQDVMTDEFQILLSTSAGNSVFYRLVTGSHGSQSPFLEIGQRDDGDTALRLDAQTWSDAWKFSTSLSANVVHTVRVIYEVNDRVRVYLDGREVLNREHTANHRIRNRWFACHPISGSALQEHALSYWIARNWWLTGAAVTPADSVDEWIHLPAIPRVPGDIGGGVEGISIWHRYDRGLYGDGGDETKLQAVFQVDTDPDFRNPSIDVVPITATNDWTAVGKLPTIPLTEY